MPIDVIGIIDVSPPPGEMPKAEGDALAIYFAMNISRVPGDIHRGGKNSQCFRIDR